jgi:mRNA interferase MazF
MKGFASEVPLPQGFAVHGAILCSHLRSVDWKARNPALIIKAPDEVLLAAREVVASIAGIAP